VYNLGMPGGVLQSAGLPNLPIELSANRLFNKSKQGDHPFDLSSIKNLPNAIQSPIMVFDSKTKADSKVILTELQEDGSNFVAVMRVRISDDGLDIDVNSIRSLYTKDRVGGIADWITDGLLLYVDKKKAANFINTQSTNLIAGVNKISSNSITNIIQELKIQLLKTKRTFASVT